MGPPPFSMRLVFPSPTDSLCPPYFGTLYKDLHEGNVKLFLHYADLTDSSNLNRLTEKVKPEEIYDRPRGSVACEGVV